jgi:hypothetical protein
MTHVIDPTTCMSSLSGVAFSDSSVNELVCESLGACCIIRQHVSVGSSVAAAAVDLWQAVVSMQAMGQLQLSTSQNVRAGACSSFSVVPREVLVLRRRRQHILSQATRGTSAHSRSLNMLFCSN